MQQESGDFQILKVPEHDRQPTAEYTPLGWRFGLHNRENLNTSVSEVVKLSVVVLLGLDEQLKWVEFCDAVVPDSKCMLRCYGLIPGQATDLSEDEIKQVLAFDALFLAVKMEMYDVPSGRGLRRLFTSHHIKSEKSEANFLSTFGRLNKTVNLDLCKIENQIPFDLIKRAFKYIERLTDFQYQNELDHPENDASVVQVHDEPPVDELLQTEPPKEGIIGRAIKYIEKLTKPSRHVDEEHSNSDGKAEQVPSDPYLEIWMKAAVQNGLCSFMDISKEFYQDANAHPRLSKSYHILDAAYKAICGVKGMQRTKDSTQDDYIHIQSARRLKDSGIRIVGVAGPLCTMSYDVGKKCLYLPKMKLHDETVALVRNLARYEEYYLGGEKCMFHDYVFLMFDLIETNQDIQLLTQCKAIHNGCGNRAFEMWSALNEGILKRRSSKEHNEMKRNIERRCKLKRYRLWSEFKTLFFSRPWLTLSTIAVVVVTIATLLQTYTAIIGSNRMKPHF